MSGTAPPSLRPAPPAGRRRDLPTTGLVVVLLGVLVLAFAGPFLAAHPAGYSIGAPLSNTADNGWLGTDRLGRDVWSQILHGGWRTVMIPLVATLASTFSGATIGLLAARRPTNRLLNGLLAVILSLPALLVLLLLFYRFGEHYWVPIAGVMIVGFPYTVRYTRAAALGAWRSHYVEQARLRGETDRWILLHEILPNVAGPVLSDTGLRFAGSVHLVTAASFLGFGPAPPATDWATQIAKNLDGGELNIWSIAAPALMIALLTVPANLLADRAAARIER